MNEQESITATVYKKDSQDDVLPDLEMFDVDNLRNNLEDIEEKLKASSSNSLHGNEISLLNCVMVFSDRIRKLIADQPSDLCTSIGSSEADSNLTFVCSICYTEFSILNNDLEFSFRMHKQSKEHINATDIHNFFGDLSDVPDQKEISKEVVIPKHKIQPVHSNHVVVEMPDWLEIRNNGAQYPFHCSYCLCPLPDASKYQLEIHSRGSRHTYFTKVRGAYGAEVSVSFPKPAGKKQGWYKKLKSISTIEIH